MLRPAYVFVPGVAPYDNPDAGYYNGWVGGIFETTEPVRGYDVDSFAAGDALCKSYFGNNAQFA